MAKIDEVLIEVRPGRTRTALLASGSLVEFIVENENRPSLVGNIYLGRVEKVIDSLNAAFIDLGTQRSGFLALAEARPAGATGKAKEKISSCLCEGEKIAVQVIRDSFEDKGPKLTTHLALTSRTVILTPGDPVIRISRRIEDKKARLRLENLLRDNAEPEEGFIIRTAAVDARDQDIEADIASLRDSWSILESGRDNRAPPSLLLSEPDSMTRALRDLVPPDVARVVIDDAQAYVRARSFLEKQAPDLLGRLSRHKDTAPLHSGEEVADGLDQALAARVSLPSGGTVIFSETPALVAIDVNTAGTMRGGREQSALDTNIEAACEIARQIRLRNLSGLLVTDFVSMKKRNNGAKILDELRRHVMDDPSQVFIGGFTRFGLVEMTRKRARPSLGATLAAPCPACAGSGAAPAPETLAYEALERLGVEVRAGSLVGMELRASPKVAAALSGPVKGAFLALEERLGVKVKITVDATLNDGDFDIVRHNQNTGEGNG